ncbi:glycosylase [Microbacterium sp. LWH13-1.2]|uniref:glycoside hydrolase family 130 protein n=1 Tax=Microbacterium sp. LWH13-1.2 TaxID=3135260 RepID=UPI003138FF43
MSALAVDAGVELGADHERVVARLFLPGESTPGGDSRTEAVLRRVLRMRPDVLAAEARSLRERFGPRHSDLVEVLRANARLVLPAGAPDLDDDTAVVVGAVFSSEFAVEGAALCNPSVVVHPDQKDLAPGELRLVLSVRSIGEGHISSIQFCEAIVGPGRTWRFLPREPELMVAEIGAAAWDRGRFEHALLLGGGSGEMVRAVVQMLPTTFSAAEFAAVLQDLRPPLLHQDGAREQIESMRVIAESAYRAEFAPTSPVSARVLLPTADEERRGMEDVRLVEIDGAHRAGGPRYRGTYTAYDGRSIASRMITTDDFRSFEVHRLTGPPSATKGMAFFPRPIAGEWVALSRTDGECTSLTRSRDGVDWGREEAIHRPGALWEVVQTGNCGPPLETDEGWLVLTHGVGPMRSYSIGALLLDLDDPSQVIGVLDRPLIEPFGAVGGYVPNVVYSCGGIIHEGTLWIPHGVADQSIRVASVDLARLLSELDRA